jgi:hypothetical protein
MLTATQARAKSQNDALVFNEVRDIEDAILTSIGNGLYEATVSGTTMTATVSPDSLTAIVYFNTWQGSIDDRAKFIQMSQVITYFTDLGYAIERRTNSLTGNTFKWVISW